jgi:hypothetical protein
VCGGPFFEVQKENVMNRWKLALAVSGLALTMGAVLPLSAQQGGGGGGGGGGGRGNFDPAQMAAQREARLKEQLGATDDEWKVIQPKLQKVTEARQAQGGGFGGFGGMGGGGRRGGAAGGDGAAAPAAPANPVAAARQELSTVLANKDSTPEQIKAKLEGYRGRKPFLSATARLSKT